MARVVMDQVSLTFKVRQNQVITLKEFLVGQMFRKGANPHMEVKALKDVTFEVNRGERLGILGHNGAGKSTLLKMLAGIYRPSSGKREVVGKISSLFDIHLGFEPEANGWENIAYRSYLQGETPTTLKGKVQAIADFTELGDFLNMPVRYYSAGMMVRLAFAIATAIDPEILLVDEVLAAGDLAFQQKALKRMREMMDRAQLVIMVSHDLNSIRNFCTKALWMDHGSVRQSGPVSEVVQAYQESVRPPAKAA